MHRGVLAYFALAVFAMPALAQKFGSTIALQVGAQSVSIPAPVGFTETSRRSPELWSMALAYSAGDARIAAHFISDQDFRAFESGSTVRFRKFLLVQVPRRAEALVTQAQFDKFRGGTVDLQKNLAAKLEPRLAAEIDKVSKSVSAEQGSKINLRMGEVVPVSVDRNDSKVIITTMMSRTGASPSAKADDVNMLATGAYCFVAGKVVIVAAYSHFDTPRDLEANRKLVSAWADALLAAN